MKQHDHVHMLTPLTLCRSTRLPMPQRQPSCFRLITCLVSSQFSPLRHHLHAPHHQDVDDKIRSNGRAPFSDLWFRGATKPFLVAHTGIRHLKPFKHRRLVSVYVFPSGCSDFQATSSAAGRRDGVYDKLTSSHPSSRKPTSSRQSLSGRLLSLLEATNTHPCIDAGKILRSSGGRPDRRSSQSQRLDIQPRLSSEAVTLKFVHKAGNVLSRGTAAATLRLVQDVRSRAHGLRALPPSNLGGFISSLSYVNPSPLHAVPHWKPVGSNVRTPSGGVLWMADATGLRAPDSRCGARSPQRAAMGCTRVDWAVGEQCARRSAIRVRVTDDWMAPHTPGGSRALQRRHIYLFAHLR